jgi:tRNA(Ile)-lysidine synthase
MITEQVRELVRAGSLFARDRPVVVMLSGGRDSTCLLDVAVALLGDASVSALHVNYGLRESADADAAHCAALCEQLGVELEVVRIERALPQRPLSAPAAAVSAPCEPPPQSGNLQAWARDVRYAQAQRVALERDALIAAGHTASDQVETILYRLAASPGRRARAGADRAGAPRR